MFLWKQYEDVLYRNWKLDVWSFLGLVSCYQSEERAWTSSLWISYGWLIHRGNGQIIQEKLCLQNFSKIIIRKLLLLTIIIDDKYSEEPLFRIHIQSMITFPGFPNDPNRVESEFLCFNNIRWIHLRPFAWCNHGAGHVDSTLVSLPGGICKWLHCDSAGSHIWWDLNSFEVSPFTNSSKISATQFATEICCSCAK